MFFFSIIMDNFATEVFRGVSTDNFHLMEFSSQKCVLSAFEECNLI